MTPRLEASSGAPRLYVGIGASAGGLDACRALLSAVPARSGLAFIVVMHLDPHREAHVAEVLGVATELAVAEATEGARVQADHVYVISPNTVLEIRGGILFMHEEREPRGKRRPIDALLSSLATDQCDRAVAVVLSGAGNDGVRGVRDVHARGGLVLAQEPETASHDAMPRSAIETGLVDRVAPPRELAELLVAHASRPHEDRTPKDAAAPDPARSEAFGEVLDLLGAAYRVDFRASYRRETLWRRAQRRIAAEGVVDIAAYRDLVRDDPARLAALYDDVLIGVTRFFRDPAVWSVLAETIMPQLLEQREDDGTLKIWVPGCATGEEAYGLAIVAGEAMAQKRRDVRLQIFATDLSERALAFARRGRYPRAIEESVSPERLERFFRWDDDAFEVRPEVREHVTFATHNLLADPPFTNVDLVSCRNLLIYLEPHAQQRVLELFHFACRRGGLLVLGESESIGSHGDVFEIVSAPARIYRAKPPAAVRVPSQAVRHLEIAPRGAPPTPGAPPSGPALARAIEQLVLQSCTAACVVVTDSLQIHSRFGPTERYLVQPTGRTRLDVLAWAKPGIYPRLRAALQQVRETNQKVTLTNLRLERGDTSPRVVCTIEPVTPLARAGRMFLIVFRDEPPLLRSAATGIDLEVPLDEPVRAEIQRLRGDLQGALEELDETNEAYRASHEELMSLNEELQSNNEALESSKEELQSLNEEMITVNRMLEDRNRELREVSTDLGNLLVSTDIPIVFLDRELKIRRFTPATRHIIHLVATDVGRPIAHVKGTVAEESLLRDARSVLADLAPVTTEVTTEDGRSYSRSVRPYRSEDGRVDGVSVAFYDVTDRNNAAIESEDARRYAEAIVGTVRDALLVLDGELRVVTANRGFTEAFGIAAPEIEGAHVLELPRVGWDRTQMRPIFGALLDDRDEILDYETALEIDGMGHRDICINARRMGLAGRGPLILLSIEDITERRRDQQLLRTHAEDLVQEHRRKDEFLAMLGHELRNPLAAVMHGLDLWRLSGEDPERLRKIREMMTRQARRIVAMLDQLLDVARLTADKIEIARVPVDVVDAARAAVEAVTPTLEARGHTLTVTLPPAGHAVVQGDFSRLTQVVENLLNNAAKYTPDRGSIALLVESDGPWAHIRVRDTGIGIDPELLPHVFELFTQDVRTLDRAAGGLGLGLPIVQRLAQMHGGSVEATSAGRGFGSEFVVTLPRLQPTDALGAAGAQAGEAGRGHVSHRILVVDDEEDAANMLADILTLKGHETRVAHDGLAALKAVREGHPDVVLLDLGLPEIDGYEVARRLRREHEGEAILLVAITGYEADAARLGDAGFDKHLLKPTDMDALLAMVDAWDPGAAVAHGPPA